MTSYHEEAVKGWSKSFPEIAERPAEQQQHKQHSWDDIVCRAAFDKLLATSNDAVTRARLLAAKVDRSAAWMDAIPISSIGLKMDNESVRIATGLRLGCNLTIPHQCKCGMAITADGRHGLVCRRGHGRITRHRMINDVIQRAFAAADVPSDREPGGLCPGDMRRPDGVTTIPWTRGKCIAWDATCPDTFSASHLPQTSQTAGSAAAAAELAKRTKYTDLDASIDFVPLAVETSRVWGAEATRLLCEIGRRTAEIAHDQRSTAFLFQRLSVALQRGNALCVRETFATVDEQQQEPWNDLP